MALNEDLPVLVTLARLKDSGNLRTRQALRARLRGQEAQKLAGLMFKDPGSSPDDKLIEQLRAIEQLAGVDS
ncbi:MAG: hypothetical protein OXU20_03780 [Myxococcales bacterium]|nr:hypothetical protein [Myxococcales bacterium]MDD9966380.1 hypothetical protein [Myxococcales bacterium]